jgi:histidyl-tRNA synthetase
MEPESLSLVYPLLRQLWEAGVAAELYPDAAKMDKQMKYANKRGIPFVAIIGEGERNQGHVSLKNMRTGKQEQIALEEWRAYFEKNA